MKKVRSKGKYSTLIYGVVFEDDQGFLLERENKTRIYYSDKSLFEEIKEVPVREGMKTFSIIHFTNNALEDADVLGDIVMKYHRSSDGKLTVNIVDILEKNHG